MTTRKELVEALRLRYRSAAFSDRIKILDEFVALTCYHRKHAIRVLRGEFSPATEVRQRNRVYDEAVVQALTVLWEAADRVCGKRLKPLIPMLVDAMERHGHLDLAPVIKTKVLQISAATIDRVLAAARAHIDAQRKRRKGVGSAIRRSIPVRTFADWLDPPPGFFEIDMVEHCGDLGSAGQLPDSHGSSASRRQKRTVRPKSDRVHARVRQPCHQSAIADLAHHDRIACRHRQKATIGTASQQRCRAVVQPPWAKAQRVQQIKRDQLSGFPHCPDPGAHLPHCSRDRA